MRELTVSRLPIYSECSAVGVLQVKMVTLMSSDMQPYEVSEEVAFMSETVKNTLEGIAPTPVCTTPLTRSTPASSQRTSSRKFK